MLTVLRHLTVVTEKELSLAVEAHSDDQGAVLHVQCIHRGWADTNNGKMWLQATPRVCC